MTSIGIMIKTGVGGIPTNQSTSAAIRHIGSTIVVVVGVLGDVMTAISIDIRGWT